MNYLKQMATICFAFATMVVSSQELSRQVVSTSGGQSQVSTLYLSWTIGQANLTGTHNNSGTTLCMGFQQSDLIPTSIEEQSPNLLKIFPNPCSDYLYIDMNNKEQTELKVILFDNYGRKYYEEKITYSGSVKHEIDMSTLPRGIYFLRINSISKTKNDINTIKIIH